MVCALRVRGRNPAVEAWAATIAVGDLFITATSVAEIERSVYAKERSAAVQGSVLRRWFEENVLPAFEGRVLSFDLVAARILATYRVPEHAPFDDALIAAVARAGGMTIATRNTKHFDPLCVSRRTDRLAAVEATFDPLSVTLEVARAWGRLAAAVAQRGGEPRRRQLDLAIAATAVTEGVPLLTLNLADFRIIADLVDARLP